MIILTDFDLIVICSNSISYSIWILNSNLCKICEKNRV